MYTLAIRRQLDEKLKKLIKKNRNQYELVMKKTQEIVLNPQHYKNLRAPLQHWKRVHVDCNFVLTFSVDDNTKTVVLEDFEHHDKIYKR